ncbi:hypothetical protein ACS0TY_007687 [Phlomoides rotata]
MSRIWISRNPIIMIINSRLKGFSVVKRTSKRAVEGDDYKYARMICDKSGSSRANKTSKRVGCTARLNAIR